MALRIVLFTDELTDDESEEEELMDRPRFKRDNRICIKSKLKPC